MRRADVSIGSIYFVKVSGKLTLVRITGQTGWGGWIAVNIATNRQVTIPTARRLRAKFETLPDDDTSPFTKAEVFGEAIIRKLPYWIALRDVDCLLAIKARDRAAFRNRLDEMAKTRK